MALRLPSAGQRFFRTLAFSLLQAAIFGSAVGLLVYFRPTPAEYLAGLDEPVPLLGFLPRALESVEVRTFDWRARELARRSSLPSNVVSMPVDRETLAFVRGEPRGEVAQRPWSRALQGKLLQELGTEGTSVVLWNVPLEDASPREGLGAPGADDAALAQSIRAVQARTVLGFEVSEAPPVVVGERIPPYLLWVANRANRAEARGELVRVLSSRRSAYVIPVSGGVQVWAGVEDEADARALSKTLGQRFPMVFREFSAQERNDQVHATDLVLEQAEVKVAGLDPSLLLQMRTLEAPVPSLLGGRASLGALTFPRAADGVLRGLPLLVNYARDEGDVHVLPSAPLAAAMALANTRTLRFSRGRLQIGDRYSLPMDASGMAYLRWDSGGIQTTPAWRLVVNLLDALSGVPPHYPLELAGRAVVFSDGRTVQPSVPTPLDGGVATGTILSQSLSNLIASRGVERTSPRFDVTVTFILAFAAAFMAFTLRSLLRSGFGTVLYVVVLVAAGFAYFLYARNWMISHGRWVAVAGPWLALLFSGVSTVLYAFRTDLEVSDFITQVLGRYVSPDVARQVFRNVALMRPERRSVSVMFSDLEGFGELNERLSPEQISELLHAWLTEVTSAVHERGGQVEYRGDSVMAFWGAPVKHANHPERACACALSVREVLTRAQDRWEKSYGQRVEFRTGIATGMALVGDLGSALKSNYTVMGEGVGMAVRLEEVNHRFGTSVVVSQTTAERAAKQYVFRELERVQLRDGRVESVFELVAPQRDFTTVRRMWLTRYEEALTLYRMRRFAEALTRFEALAGEDPVSRVYWHRTRDLMEKPPPPEWDATVALQQASEAA